MLFAPLLFLGLPAQANYVGQQLPLSGRASYSWFFFDVWEAQLWSPNTKRLYDNPLELELTYKRNFAGKAIWEQTEVELKSAEKPEAIIRELMAQLDSVFPDIKKGDKIMASYKPKEGVTLYLNRKVKLTKIEDRKLANAFLDIWLGEKSTAPKVRNKLLGVQK